MTVARFLPKFSRSHTTVMFATLGLLAAAIGSHAAAKPAPQGVKFQPEKAIGFEPAGAGAAAFNAQQARPTAMVSADFDVDGVKDLAVGYGLNKGGVIAIMRGNLDAIAPQTEQSFKNAGHGVYADAFLSLAEMIPVPVEPDFLITADVNGDGYLDLVFAAKNGNALYVLSGNGKGQFTLQQPLTVQGTVTALAGYRPGDNSSADALVVGVKTGNGYAAELYRIQRGTLQLKATFAMPGVVTSIATANLDSDLRPDAAIIAGGQVLVLHSAGAITGKARLETLATSDAVSLTTGSFLFDRHAGLQLAVLSSDGTVHFLAHAGFDPRPFTVQEITAARRNAMHHLNAPTLAQIAGNTGDASFTEVETLNGVAPAGLSGAAPLLLRARASGSGGDDLLTVNGAQQEIAVVRHPANPMGSLPAATGIVMRIPLDSGDVVAALAQRVSPRGADGLVVLKHGSPRPEIVTPASGNTLYVNSFADTTIDANDAARCTNGSSETCTLRDAITYANADATDNIPDATSDTIMIPAGTYNLAYEAGTNDANNNAVTHLEILGPMTLIGGSGGATINAQSNDVVFTINPGAYGSYNPSGDSYVFDTEFENLTITGGQNFNNPANSSTGMANNVSGGINWDADGTGNLTLTNCTVSSNTNGWGDGGGIWFYNSAGGGAGTVTLSGSTVSSNNTSEQGGGIYQASAPAGFSAINTSITGNAASPTVNTNDPGGASGADAAGAIYLTAIPSASGIPSATITGNNITGNSADGDGGGIYTTQGISISGGTNISNNTATGSGGGVFHNADATTTIAAANITSNSATNTGGGITVGTELASNGNALTIANSRFFGNTSTNGASGLSVGEPSSTGAGAVTATENWWGCNAGPATLADGCDQAVLYDSTNGSMSVSPNIVLTIGANPSSVSLGNAIDLTAAVNTDSNSAPVSGGPGALEGLTIDFAATVGAFSASPTATIDATGEATASITPTNTGTGTASATLDNQTVSTNITVNSGPATYFVITGPNPAPWYTVFDITVTAYDASNNVATSYNGTVAFISNDPGFYNPGPLTLTNGVGVVGIVFKTAGTDTVTATDTVNSSLTGTGSFTVPPGPASRFILSTPSSTIVGSAFNFTVGAYDLYGNVATAYTGAVAFTSTDPAAGLPASYTFVPSDNGQHTFSATLNTAGSQTITATDAANSITGTSSSITVTIPSFVVNTATDDATGTASNCTTTPEGTCTLRDALAAAANAGSGNITFDPTAFSASNTAAQNTITITSGLTVDSYTTITGPTSGSSATLANLVTINGGGSSSNFPIFSTPSSALNILIQNLIITDGNNSTGNGGTISNGYQAALTIQDSTISGNNSTGPGAIFNDYNASVIIIGSTISGNTGGYGAIGNESGGTVTITDSTISGNSTSTVGGAIINDGAVTVNDSTIFGNNAGTAGGIYNNAGTATLNNTILAGNTDTVGTPDGDGAFSGSDNLIGNGAGITGITNGTNGNEIGTSASPLNPMLSALGNYGGPTQTMLPLPGSPVICSGSSSVVPSGTSTDQRGVAFNAGGYCPTNIVDEGAVQTDYSIGFSTNPPASVVSQTSFTAAVTLDESGAPVSVSGVSIPLTLNASAGTLSGGSATTTHGVATYSALQVSAEGQNDTLTATLIPGGGSASISATSSQFNVISPLAPTISMSFSPSIVAPGGQSTLTVTLGNPNTATTLTHVVMSDTLPAGLTGQTPQTVSCTVAGMSGANFANLSIEQPSLSPGQSCSANFVVQAGSTSPITYTDIAIVTADQWSGASPTAAATLTVPAPATQFSVISPAIATGGTAFNFTVTALDASNGVVPTYSGTVHFTSTDPNAALPADATLTNGTGTFSATLATLGNQTITATDTVNASITGTSGAIAVSAPSFVVENTNDSGTGSLRAALANAATAGSGNITFDPTVFTASNTAAQNTITLASGLTIPTYTTITGATTGSGATLTNLVTIDGGGTSSNFSMFTVSSGVTDAAISNLNITDGWVNSQGGAINTSGSLTVTQCDFTNNYAGGYFTGGGNGGGAIWLNAGNLTINLSTFSGNTGSPGGAISAFSGALSISDSTFSGNHTQASKFGGAIFNNNVAITIAGSTFTNNTAPSGGGGAIYNYGTLTVTNSIMAGNNGGDCDQDNATGCPTNTNGNITGVSNIDLAPLGNYGGPTQTAIPLPGSPAICAGLAANIPVGFATDQRGLPITNPNYPGYSAIAPCVDAGSVQSNYSIAFSTNPPASVVGGANFSAAVALIESGNPFEVTATPLPTIGIPLTLTGNGNLTGGSANVNDATGIATYSGLQVNLAGNGDILTATLPLNPALTPSLNLTSTSNPFNVTQSSTTTAASNATATYSSTAQSVTLTATVTSSGGTVNAGTVTFAVFNGATQIGAAATSGTVTNGLATASYTLPGGTSANTYTIQATYSGSGQFTGSVDNSHTLTVNAASTTTTASNATVSYSASAQSATFSATVTSAAGTVNSGTVTFTVFNGGTPVGTATTSGTVTNGQTTVSYVLPAGTPAGTYTIHVSYNGSTNFTGSSFTANLTIGQAAATVQLSGLTQTYAGSPISVTATTNPAGLSVSITYNGSTTAPTNAGSYPVVATITNPNYTGSATGTLMINPAAATVQLSRLTQTYTGSPISVTATTIPAGLSVSITYNGSATAPTNAGSYPVIATITSANYTGSATGTLTINPAAATVQLSGLTQTYTGSPISVTATTNPSGLSVTITYNGSATAPTHAGSYPVVATITNPNYTGSATGTLTIAQANPTVAWSTPAAITYGTALSSTQLDATASVAGAFVYAPGAGTVLSAGPHTLSVSFTPTDTTDYSTPSAVTTTIMVNQATLVVIANNATKVYGTANPTFTGSVTGAVNNDSFIESFTTTATTSSNVGAYPIVPGVTGADLSDYTVTTTDGTLTITQAASSISLIASATSITPGQSVTFTASVASATTGTPSGSVTFYDDGTALGTVTLNSGAASFTTATLAPGLTHTISATYSGNTDFTGSSTTATLSITVAPLEFTITFNGATTESVYPGGTVTYTFQVAPEYGLYAGPMNFQISGLPSTATATFSPDTIPANGGPQTVTLTITDAALSSAASPPTNLPKRIVPFALALLLLPLAGARRIRKHGRSMRQMLWVLMLAASALSATILSGCGSANGFFTQAPQNYSVTITATAGDVQKTATVTLNVQ
jgi:CSLREA domain-containing protein